MVTAPASRIVLSVPLSTAGEFSSVTGGGAELSAPFKSSARGAAGCRASQAASRNAPVRTRVMAGARSGHRRSRGLRARLIVIDRRTEILLELGDRASSQRVADDVGGAAPHVEELVDAEDQEQPDLGQAELLQGREDHHQRGTR